MPPQLRDCPCKSGLRYNACCGPLHRGATAAASPEALMRSRFSAFAIGAGDYLVATLSADHEDLKVPPAVLAKTLAAVKDSQRFVGLEIAHASEEGDDGEVLYIARVFEKGKDRSFGELSRFRREGGAWRYVDGDVVGAAKLPTPLTRDAFLSARDR